MKIRHATVGATALLTASALALTGCNAANPGAADSETSTWNEPTASLEGTTLTLWSQPVTATYADQVIEAFEEATGAEVDIEILPDDQAQLTQIATGDTPDLAWWQPTRSAMAVLQPEQNLLPLDDMPWLDELDPAIREIGVVDGTRYAAMVSTPSVLGVFYNKGIFEEHGLSEPTDWESFTEVARTLESEGVVPFYEAAGDAWPTQWWPQVQVAEAAQDGYWDRVNAGEATFSSPEMLSAIEEYQSLINEGLFNSDITTATFSDQGSQLLAGNAAMVLQDSAAYIGLLQSLSEGESIDDQVGWFPISREGNVATSIPTGANAVVAFRSGDSEREAAARQFLRFWMETNYEDYIASLSTPSIKTDVENPEGISSLAIEVQEALPNSVGSMQSLAAVNVDDFYRSLADMINGAKTPEEVAEAAQAQFNDLARARGLPGF